MAASIRWAGPSVVPGNSEYQFKITFPTQVKIEEKIMDVPVGDEKLKLYLVGVEGEKKAYLASYCDYPKDLIANADLDEMLENVMKGMLEGMKGKEKSTEKIKIQGHKGRELVFEIPELKVHGKARAFLHENRLYQVIAFEDNEKPVHVDEFLRSFKLIKDK